MKKLRLAGIASYDAANRLLQESYVADHNRRFARAAKEQADFTASARPTRNWTMSSISNRSAW